MTESKFSALQVDIAIFVVWGVIFTVILLLAYYIPLLGLCVGSFFLGIAVRGMMAWKKIEETP